MNPPPRRHLLLDLYQLTMAQAYLHAGRARDEAVFHLFFRELPFGGGYAIACGLAEAVIQIEGLRFERDDLDYLRGLRDGEGTPLFGQDFLRFLTDLRLQLDVDAIPEGTPVFPPEPLVRVRGPLLQAQLVETLLINSINFPTLVATKAARICQAASADPVIELGLRRAQGPDGALTATRAAFVGGCAGTSSVEAGRLFGIPVRGTQAHSWVMSFDSEPEAFAAYGAAFPRGGLFLVDTYDTAAGIRNAIEVGRRLRSRGGSLGGIRIDSGDLAALARLARGLLDQAGFPEAVIVASNDLDEHLIEALKRQGAPIDVWGVGTRLVTCHDQPALGCVYKMAGVRRGGEGPWRHRIKVSEQPVKLSTPGVQQVRRFRGPPGDSFLVDVIFDEQGDERRLVEWVDPGEPLRRGSLDPALAAEDLLVPIFRGGRRVYDPPGAQLARARTQAELSRLPAPCRRLRDPHRYPVGLDGPLAALRSRLAREARGAG